MVNIHIFRRDLRLDDNTTLNETQTDTIPIFIFTPTQIEKNDYKSDFALAFLCHSLLELDEALQKKGSKLHVFYGEPTDVLNDICKDNNITSISFNKDYTPYALRRDGEIEDFCQANGIACNSYHDTLLTPPDSITKDDGKPYTVYTPFYKKASSTQEVAQPKTSFPKLIRINSGDKSIIEKIKPDARSMPKILLQGGRKEALSILYSLKEIKDYKTIRDIPAVKGTSKLSAHHKFGTISIRETYWHGQEVFGADSQFIKELYWRDFFTQIAFNFPYVFGKEFQEKYQGLKWKDNEEWLTAWCEGKTGFPIVDAGMRELNNTGYMHNRVRMIVSSFLTKDLHIDWRKGEKYFAQKLIDYDPAVNNGSWQWAASTGCDAQPYFRIFNPWLQQKKFDTDCKYIKKWVPELVDLDASEIHKLDEQRPLSPIDYPKPIVNHKDQKEYALAMFKTNDS